MNEEAVFLIVIIVAAVPMRYVVARITRSVKYSRRDEELRKMFLWFWNGSPEDELYAWYKVRMILKQREDDQKKVEHVDQKILEFNKTLMCGNSYITEEGRLISEDLDLVV